MRKGPLKAGLYNFLAIKNFPHILKVCKMYMYLQQWNQEFAMLECRNQTAFNESMSYLN